MSGIERPIPSKTFSSQENEVFTVTKMTENVYKMMPMSTLRQFPPGKDFYVFYEATVPAHRFDVFPNWYITAPSVHPRIIECTAGESLSFVHLFNGPEAYKIAHPGGLRTPEAHYDEIDTVDMGRAPIPVLPTPLLVTRVQTSRMLFISTGWTILYRGWTVAFNDKDFENEALYLAEKLNLKSEFVSAPSSMPGQNTITLMKGHVETLQVAKDSKPLAATNEAYSLKVLMGSKAVLITSSSSGGIFYGIKTLLSLLKKRAGGYEVPPFKIIDAPRMEYRGLMLDVSRNFFDVNTVKKLIDLLARYKMNRLHLHLTDNQGWRIEIPGLPELTEFGSRRGHDPEEENHLMMVFGSGPHSNKTSGSGFYTTNDYREILVHAKRNHIEVVPEIDLPGHARAAIRAMQKRYDIHATSDAVRAKEFLLNEPRFMHPKLGLNPKDNVVPFHLPSTYKFVDHVVKSLVNMHRDILPLNAIHLGADEVASLGQKDQMAFTRKFVEIAFRYNLTLHLWHDHYLTPMNAVWPYTINPLSSNDTMTTSALKTSTTAMSPNNTNNRRARQRRAARAINLVPRPPCPNFTKTAIVLQHWRNEQIQQTLDLYRIPQYCYKVIHSAANRLYLDQPQDTHPEERGNMWAAHKIDTRAVHSYTPDFPLDNIGPGYERSKGVWKESARDRCKTNTGQCKQEQIKPEKNYGMEVALWTEVVRTPEQVFDMVLPRLIAAAERSWHRADWEWQPDAKERKVMRNNDWNEFINTVGYREIPLLEEEGFNYHMPTPGARFKDGKLLLKSEIPGLHFEISTDDKVSWKTVKNGKVANLDRNNHVYARLSTVNGKNHGRTIKVIQTTIGRAI